MLIYNWFFGSEEEIVPDEKQKKYRHSLLKEIREFDADLLVPAFPPEKKVNKKLFKKKRNRPRKR
jgi:hypothetical protein